MLAILLTLAAAAPLHVRTSVAFAPCVNEMATAYTRDTGRAVTVEVALPRAPGAPDVVVGDDSEMRRVLEGGEAVIATAVELGEVPWVYVTPAGMPMAAFGTSEVAVLGGAAGREARTLLTKTGAARTMRILGRAEDLRAASTALVPLSLAGRGEHRRADVTPLQATAAEMAAGANRARAREFLVYLATPSARTIADSCLRGGAAAVSPAMKAGADVYARAVTDWWIPECSLTHNGYNDPGKSLGPPDAVNLGGKDNYSGLVSLGQGGYVTLELTAAAVNGSGPDIRVFQSTSNEPVTLYAATTAAGPFVLLGLQKPCGTRTPGVFSNHCDFDLADGGLASARYVKIEDGEIYPCLAGGTLTEGADIDSVQALNQ
jgi:hypothetical protein